MKSVEEALNWSQVHVWRIVYESLPGRKARSLHVPTNCLQSELCMDAAVSYHRRTIILQTSR